MSNLLVRAYGGAHGSIPQAARVRIPVAKVEAVRHYSNSHESKGT